MTTMTRLDIGRLNKDYIDADQFEHSRSLNTSSVSSVGVKSSGTSHRSNSVTLSTIQDVLKSQDLAKVKSLVRSSELPVNHEARGNLWILLCSGTAEHFEDDETFQMYAAKFSSVASESLLPIHDMPEEMRVHHMLSEEGVKACHRVLYVISETHPHIQQFSPLLYAFTSIMLHYMNEQTCFRAICDLLKKKDVEYFLAPTELKLNAVSHVLRDLAFRYVKGAAVFIERNSDDFDLAQFCNDWVLWIFKHLPFHYIVRIIDCYLVEGFKVLFRITLVLIRLFHKVAANKSHFISSSRKVDTGMKTFCSEIESYISCDKLLKEAFGIRGFSKKEIDSLFTKTELSIRGGGLVTVRTPRPSESDAFNSNKPNRFNERNKKLIASRSKKSFKLDKDIHTQLIIEDVHSEILTKPQLNKVWNWLPPAEAVKEPCLAFTTNEDGYSLKTFYEKVENKGPTLIIIRTMNDEIFGAYCSADWVERHKYFDTGAQISYFGTGQSFVFSINPELYLYSWVGKNQPVTPQSSSMFQAGDRSMIMVGGGNGCAIQIDKDLDYGSSGACETYDNPPLVAEGSFRTQSLEAFVFE